MNRLIITLMVFLALPTMAQQKPKLIYVADPLCSWCYGFQVAIDHILSSYPSQVKFEILVGGMGIENHLALNAPFIEELEHHWAEVHKTSGQVFDNRILHTKGLIYNSEPLCRAIVTTKELDSSKAIYMHKALQKAFYSQNKNVTQLYEIKMCALELGLDTAIFAQLYVSQKMKDKTQAEFERVDKNGVSGFPVLLLVTDHKTVLITDGYTTYKKLQKQLKKNNVLGQK